MLLGEFRNKQDEKPLTEKEMLAHAKKAKKMLQGVDWEKARQEVISYYGNHKKKEIRSQLPERLSFIEAQRKFAQS